MIISYGLNLMEMNNPESLRPYHFRGHPVLVLREVTKLGLEALWRHKINCRDLELLKIAAAFHDVIQNLGPGKNEDGSARLASFGMSVLTAHNERDALIVVRCIQGTKVIFDENGVMHQEAENGGYLAKLLADADLSALGASEPEFIEMAIRFMKESTGKKVLSQTDLKEGWKKQVKFMTGRKYLTEEAERLYRAQFERNMHLAIELSGDSL